MDIIQGCRDNADNYIYSGHIVDTDKCTTIRDYVCYSSGSSLLEATSVATTSYNEDTSGYHGIVSYDRNNYAMKSSDVACSGNDRILASSLQDEDLPELPLDLSVSCISKRYVSSNSTCLQKEPYSDISQCPQPARQSPIASPDLTSLSSSSPLSSSSSSSAAAAAATSAAAAATAVVELNAFSIRNTSLSSIPTCFKEEIHGDPNQCRQSTNQSPIAPHDLTAAAAAAGATTAAEAEAAEAALDLSVPSVRYLPFIPIRLQTKTQRASSQCPQTTNQPPIGPSKLVAMAELCYLCGNQLCLSDKSETHICSKKLTFSSPNPVDIRTVYRNMTSPQSTDDSFGPRTRKRSASPEQPDEQSTRMPYVSEPDGGQVTSSLLPITPSINNITSSTSPITSSGSPLTNRSVLDTIIRTTLPTQQSPLHNPRKKQVMTHEKDELPSGLCLQDSSNTTMTSLNKCNNARNIAASIQTPAQEDRVTIAGVRKIQMSIPVSKKPKIVRRLNFGFDTSSPVSGTIIKQAADLHPDDGILVCNDIDPGCNVVEVTAEAKAELQKIQNVIGDYICQLCNAFYEDAFKLAQHRCSKIVHVEYRCTECGKVFNCPANLASHSRWHKPASNDKKGMKAKGLPRNPSSAQRQPIQPDMMGDYVCKIVSSRKLVSAAKSVSSRFNDNKSSDSQHSKYLLPVTNVYVNVDQSKLQRYIPSNTELVAKTSNLNGAIHNTSVCQKEGVSDIVKYKQAQAHPHEDLLEKTHAASAKFISNSRSDHFVNSDHSAISQCNILHTSYGSYDSRLTQQEKPLVRDCLDSHSLQPQITSLSNANNEITHSLTDSLSNSDDTVYRTISKSSNNSRYTRIDDCKSNVACNNRSNLSTGTDTSSKTILIPYCPRPADFTRCHVGKLDSHQNGKMQNPIALSERQGNQQNECSVCGKRFQRHLYLQKHVQHQHRNENTFSCEKTTSTDNNVCRVLDGNTSGESGECVCKTTRLFCSNCDQVFTTQAAKLKHDAAMHGLRSLLSCNTCEMTFTSKTAADKHVRGAHKVDILSCKHCPSTFHSSQSLTRHINKCHPTENRQVILLQLSSVHTR